MSMTSHNTWVVTDYAMACEIKADKLRTGYTSVFITYKGGKYTVFYG